MNLLTRLKKSNIKLTDLAAVKKFLVGKYVEILGTENNNSHGYNTGRKFLLTKNIIYYANNVNLDLSSLNDVGSLMNNYIFLSNLKLINDKVTAADFNAEVELINEQQKELLSQKAKVKEILKYMQENELTEFDEDVYQVYKILKKIKGSGSDIEKATEIANLLKKD